MLYLWIWAAAFQTLHSGNNNAKGHIKAKVQGFPLWRASTQTSRFLHPETNSTYKILLESADFVAKWVTKKRIVGLKTHPVDHNTISAKHLYSHRDHSSCDRKTKAVTMLKVDIQW